MEELFAADPGGQERGSQGQRELSGQIQGSLTHSQSLLQLWTTLRGHLQELTLSSSSFLLPRCCPSTFETHHPYYWLSTYRVEGGVNLIFGPLGSPWRWVPVAWGQEVRGSTFEPVLQPEQCSHDTTNQPLCKETESFTYNAEILC